MQRLGLGWVTVFILLLTATSAHAEKPTGQPESMTFGILPFMSHATLFERFSALRDFMSEILGASVEIETAKSFEEFIRRTDKGDYAIVYTAPHFVVPALDSGLYDVVASPSAPLAAHILVRAQSVISSVKDLAGKRVALPPENAFVTLVGKRLLAEKGLINAARPQYLIQQSHNAAYRAVLADDADGAIIGTYAVAKALEEGMKVIDQTAQYPSTAFLIQKRFGNEKYRKLKDAITSLHLTAHGRAILKATDYSEFRASNPQDYDELRPLWETIKGEAIKAETSKAMEKRTP